MTSKYLLLRPPTVPGGSATRFRWTRTLIRGNDRGGCVGNRLFRSVPWKTIRLCCERRAEMKLRMHFPPIPSPYPPLSSLLRPPAEARPSFEHIAVALRPRFRRRSVRQSLARRASPPKARDKKSCVQNTNVQAESRQRRKVHLSGDHTPTAESFAVFLDPQRQYLTCCPCDPLSQDLPPFRR